MPPLIEEHADGISVFTLAAVVQTGAESISSFGIILTAKTFASPKKRLKSSFLVKDLLSHEPPLRATDNCVSESAQGTIPRDFATPRERLRSKLVNVSRT